MATDEAQAPYRRLSGVAEFCHAWIKTKLGLRQFHVRSFGNVQREVLCAYLTNNLHPWIRLDKLPPAPVAI